MMPSHDELRARLADGLPAPGFKGIRAASDKSPPKPTTYSVSAAEFNATLPPVAHEAATARAIEAACRLDLQGPPCIQHPREAHDEAAAYLRALSFDWHNPKELEAAGLIREEEFTLCSHAGYPPKPVYRRERRYVPTSKGRRLCARVRHYLAGGGQLPVRPVADILRSVAALQAPAVAMPAPHPFVVSKYAEPKDVLRHAQRAAEQQERDLLARLGFNSRNSATRRLSSMDRILLRRDMRDAELLGLVRLRGDTLITTDQGARQAAEIPAPNERRRAA